MELIGSGVLPNMPPTLEKLSFALNRLTTGKYLFEFSSLRKLKEFNMTLLLRPTKHSQDLFERCYEKKDFTVLVESSKSQNQGYSGLQRYFLYKCKRLNDSISSSTRPEDFNNLPDDADLVGAGAKESYEQSRYNNKNPAKPQYSFHAFISYVGKNRGFVFQKMKPILESKGLKLIIRDIHFEIGNSKIDNIMKAISRSNRTICVVSKEYLKSKWRTYELNMAKMEGINKRGSLGYVHLILMPDLFEGGCDTAIKDFIEEKYFLDYPPEDSSLQKEFWENLSSIIRSPC
ncbi:uncharacterized protein LOC134268820 [Saccostrea cucullata]|uniref:uncharacterized protein LOC134268820 n=1 Tax=Saccostrea cuccullata TaxID=36930 RepID=UPI002ED19839